MTPPESVLLDPCSRPELLSSGNINGLNNTLGHPNGVPAQVQSVGDVAPLNLVELASVGIHPPMNGQSVAACHMTLNLVDGRTESGIFSIWDPGQYAQLQYWWMSDQAIAAQRAKIDHLQNAKNLYVKPNLVTPEIQVCVGRQTALGVDEQFPGQLWAACADKRAKLR